MGRREKQASQIVIAKSEDNDYDDDDVEANEDLSLKIVEKAMLCKRKDSNSIDGVDQNNNHLEAVVVTNLKDDMSKKKEKKMKKKKKKKGVKIEADIGSVDFVKAKDKLEGNKAAEIVTEAAQTNPVEMSDNIVLRKLLRGPRYFDPPDSGWGTCYNCGEEGHMTANCTSARRKKPCFVCGSLEHNAKQCPKGQDCFICKRGGHRARDCPEKNGRGSRNSKLCLKCGDSGHEMFSCRNNYCPDDLKEIKCYICGSFGHLCCVDFSDIGPREVSCYRCGLSGHTGLACTGSREETTGSGSVSSCFKCGEVGHFARECINSTKACSGSRGETTGSGSISSCFKCGGVGHFARECINSTKAVKRNRELSTPKKRSFKENRDYLDVESTPLHLSKGSKKRKSKYEGGFASSSKSKQRRGWITEDPGDFLNGQANGGWRSPSTPDNWRTNYGAPASSSHSFRKPHKLNFSNSSSNGSAKFYQHRFSASRFGNYNAGGGMGRNYDW